VQCVWVAAVPKADNRWGNSCLFHVMLWETTMLLCTPIGGQVPQLLALEVPGAAGENAQLGVFLQTLTLLALSVHPSVAAGYL
jgi:hypothetical protein